MKTTTIKYDTAVRKTINFREHSEKQLLWLQTTLGYLGADDLTAHRVIDYAIHQLYWNTCRTLETLADEPPVDSYGRPLLCNLVQAINNHQHRQPTVRIPVCELAMATLSPTLGIRTLEQINKDGHNYRSTKRAPRTTTGDLRVTMESLTPTPDRNN
jgi:hypothetical protein